MARPEEYGFEMGAEFEHPEYGEVEVVSKGEWPVTLMEAGVDGDTEPEYYEVFEFEAEDNDFDI